MNWTRRADLRMQVQKLWDRGDVLSSLVTGRSLFPKRLVFKSPSSAEMTDHFEEVRSWISELRAMPYCRLEMRQFKHRVFGVNVVPDEAWIDTVEDALALISKQRDAVRFNNLIDLTCEREPRLLTWLSERPIRALELFNEWGPLLTIVAWLQMHPRPGIYLRQVDIPGVHSKFIEAYRAVLSELLDIVLPADAIAQETSGMNQFAKRYGFCDKPVRIRFRILDHDHALLPGILIQDITLDSDSFACLDPNVSRVFITENEINFLAFPQVKDSMVIFGSGYGFDMLNKAKWLSRCRIYYWGDIDTHGFAILDQLRSQFDRVESFLMDRKTLLNFERLWGIEETQKVRDLPKLYSEERELYDDLRDNRIRENLRLEQERIGFRWVESALSNLSG